MNRPRIRRQHGFWCVFRTPESTRPVIVGHEFARVCKGARRMFPKRYTATLASVIVQGRGADYYKCRGCGWTGPVLGERTTDADDVVECCMHCGGDDVVKCSAMNADPSKQHRGDAAETSPVPKNP